MIEIPSLDDERLRGYRLATDPSALRAHGLFVAEGRLVVRRLLPMAATGGHRFENAVESVLLTPAAHGQIRDVLDRYPAVPIYVVPQTAMDAVVGFNIHRGCLALARRPATPGLDGWALSAISRAVVLEGVNNPDNVGGIFRSAAAFGVDLVVLGPGCADPLYRKAIRTSMGATLAVPYVEAGTWPEAIARMRAAGIRVVALTTDADATPLPALPADGRPVALLAGAEGHGLSAEAAAAADVRTTIRMTDLVDSLNVTSATSIALYHFLPGAHREPRRPAH